VKGQTASVSTVGRLKRAELEQLVAHLELSDEIKVSDFLKSALVKKVNGFLASLGYFGEEATLAAAQLELEATASDREKAERDAKV